MIKQIIKIHFNKNLLMSADELFHVGDNKVTDYNDVTEKYRGSAHWSFIINLRLNKKVPVIFDNLKGYGSHLIIWVIGKFDVKISVTPNGVEKYMVKAS